jgi:MraZ protein
LWVKVEKSGAPAPTGVPPVKGEVEHMFLGQYQHSIDNKGRLTIPSRFREILADEGAYILQGFDRNLFVLPEPAFEIISNRVNSLSMTDGTARALRRLIFSTAERVEADRSGRILIPDFLRQSANLVTDAYIIGAGSYFEIWSPELWGQQVAQIQDDESNGQRFALLDLSI